MEANAWQPMETCPTWKVVLFLLPEFDCFADSAWVGMRKSWSDRDNRPDTFEVKTPFSENGKQVWVSELPQPIAWMLIPTSIVENNAKDVTP